MVRIDGPMHQAAQRSGNLRAIERRLLRAGGRVHHHKLPRLSALAPRRLAIPKLFRAIDPHGTHGSRNQPIDVRPQKLRGARVVIGGNGLLRGRAGKSAQANSNDRINTVFHQGQFELR